MSAKTEQLVAMRLNSYFKDQPQTPALVELKAELTSDLNEAAADKQQAGLAPEEAVAEAFSDFGDINELIRQINAENGTTKTIHGHHVVMDDDGIRVDDGETLKINNDGVYVKGGRAFKADSEGVSINDGAIKADSHGLKLGSWTFNEDGINLNGDAQAQPDFKVPSMPLDLTGEYTENLPLVNERRFDAKTITTLVLHYKSARVKILPTQGDTDEIIVREYMNHNNTTYQAQVSQNEEELKVTQGKVPFLIPLRVHVQIHVPISLTGNVMVTSRSGSVLVAGLPHLDTVNLQVISGSARVAEVGSQAFSADVTSGSCDLDGVQVTNQLGMLVKSGRIRMHAVTAGQFTISATSGTVTGDALNGGGSWSVKSGSLKLAFANIAGDINLNAKSGSIKVGVPSDASYAYELEAQSGRITAPKNGSATHFADGYQAGQVGITGTYTIKGRTTSGTIRLG